MEFPTSLNSLCETAYKGCEYAYNNMPTAKTLVNSTLAMTTSAIAVECFSRIVGADAGPITYAACVAGCGALVGPAVPACVFACAPLFFAPSP